MSDDLRNVLLIEDDYGDIELIKTAIKQSNLKINLSVATNGNEALTILGSENPSLIILDLNLPQMNGKQLLQSIKKDSKLANIPVITLTASTEDEDIRQTQQYGANAFITKPERLNGYKKIPSIIESFLENASD